MSFDNNTKLIITNSSVSNSNFIKLDETNNLNSTQSKTDDAFNAKNESTKANREAALHKVQTPNIRNGTIRININTLTQAVEDLSIAKSKKEEYAERVENVRKFFSSQTTLTSEMFDEALKLKAELSDLQRSDSDYKKMLKSLFKPSLTNLEHLQFPSGLSLAEMQSFVLKTTDKLAGLDFSQVSLPDDDPDSIEDFFIDISDHCNLTSLNLDNQNEIDPDTLVEMTENLPNLVYLNLNHWDNELSTDHIIEFSSNLPNLEMLYIKHFDASKISIDVLKPLSENCLKLQELCIDFEDSVTKTELDYLSNLPLEVLDLNNYENITSVDIVKLVHDHPNLIELSLAGCPNIDENALKAIATLRNLKKLDLTIATIKDPDGLINVVKACKENLNELILLDSKVKGSKDIVMQLKEINPNLYIEEPLASEYGETDDVDEDMEEDVKFEDAN